MYAPQRVSINALFHGQAMYKRRSTMKIATAITMT
jgi:hypothetical protein